MKWTFQIGGVFFFFAASAFLGAAYDAQSARQMTTEQQLIQLERDWCAADLSGDAAFFQRTLSDDITFIGSRGVTQTKNDFLSNLKDKATVTTTCVMSDVKVRVYGDAAVVTGLNTRSGTYKGAAYKDRRALWTDTFIKKGGRWLCVATQSTVVAAQQK